MPLIEARDLTKRFRIPRKGPGLRGSITHLFAPKYENKTALDGVSFDINAGDAVAYVGPNGAGKSTTVKLLTGILAPTSGTARVATLDPHRERMRNARTIGVVFGQRTQLWWDLPVQESLRLLADIYEIPPAQFAEQMKTIDELLELQPKPCRGCNG